MDERAPLHFSPLAGGVCVVAEGVGTVWTCHRLLWEPDPAVVVDVVGYQPNDEDPVWSFAFAGPVGGLL